MGPLVVWRVPDSVSTVACEGGSDAVLFVLMCVLIFLVFIFVFYLLRLIWLCLWVKTGHVSGTEGRRHAAGCKWPMAGDARHQELSRM